MNGACAGFDTSVVRVRSLTMRVAVAVAHGRAVTGQRLCDISCPLRTLCRILRQAREDDFLQRLVNRRPKGARRLRELVNDPIDDRLGFPGERRLPRRRTRRAPFRERRCRTGHRSCDR